MKKLNVGVKPIRLSGRGSDYARRALALPANGSLLIVQDNVPLSLSVDDDTALGLAALYGPLQRSRKVDVSCLPAGALIDVHITDPQFGDVYSHTEANPLWWTPARIALVWHMVASAEQTGEGLIPSQVAHMLHKLGGGK